MMAPYRHLPRAQRLAHQHPFALALLVMLLIVVPGFIRVEQIQRNFCHSGNDARASQIQLWTYIIGANAPPPPQRTEREKAQIAALEQRLHEIFKPRDCH